MNKEQQQIIDEVWKCFSNVRKSMLMLKPPASENKLGEYIEWYEQITTKEEFINKCKTDVEFSDKWGLEIEERELSDDELNIFNLFKQNPTKLITITYNNETIEIYE
jgi:hypothetical protein